MKKIILFFSIYLITACQLLQGPEPRTTISTEKVVELMNIVSPILTNLIENVDNKTIQISFNKDPGSLTISISSNSTSISINPATLIINSGNYTTPQNITISALDDTNFDNETSISIEIKINGALYRTINASTLDNDKKTFSVGAAPSGFDGVGGIPAIDALCNSDAKAVTIGGSFKAMIVDGTTRRAATTPNASGGASEQIDWVFKPQFSYYNDTGSVFIFTANQDGINNFAVDGNFSSSFEGSTAYATGLNADWTTQATTCSNWNSNTGSSQSGGSLDVDSNAIYGGGNYMCSQTFWRALCVQQ